MKKYFKQNTILSPACILSLLLVSALELNAQLLLPESNLAAGWQKSPQTLYFAKSNLFDYIDGGAEIFLEFGFNELWVQGYTKEKEEIILEAYKMTSPAAALGIYLIRCGKEIPIPGISARNSGNRLQFNIVKGRYFIQVNNASGREALVPEMTVLTEALLSSIPAENPVNLFDYLPQKKLIKGSERFVRGVYSLQPFYTFGAGDVLQLEGRNFGVVGDYQDDTDNEYTRLIFIYTDTIYAVNAFENLSNNLDSYLKLLKKINHGFIFKDYQEKFGRVELKENQIEILIKLTKEPPD